MKIQHRGSKPRSEACISCVWLWGTSAIDTSRSDEAHMISISEAHECLPSGAAFPILPSYYFETIELGTVIVICVIGIVLGLLWQKPWFVHKVSRSLGVFTLSSLQQQRPHFSKNYATMTHKNSWSVASMFESQIFRRQTDGKGVQHRTPSKSHQQPETIQTPVRYQSLKNGWKYRLGRIHFHNPSPTILFFSNIN